MVMMRERENVAKKWSSGKPKRKRGPCAKRLCSGCSAAVARSVTSAWPSPADPLRRVDHGRRVFSRC